MFQISKFKYIILNPYIKKVRSRGWMEEEGSQGGYWNVQNPKVKNLDVYTSKSQCSKLLHSSYLCSKFLCSKFLRKKSVQSKSYIQNSKLQIPTFRTATFIIRILIGSVWILIGSVVGQNFSKLLFEWKFEEDLFEDEKIW